MMIVTNIQQHFNGLSRSDTCFLIFGRVSHLNEALNWKEWKRWLKWPNLKIRLSFPDPAYRIPDGVGQAHTGSADIPGRWNFDPVSFGRLFDESRRVRSILCQGSYLGIIRLRSTVTRCWNKNSPIFRMLPKNSLSSFLLHKWHLSKQPKKSRIWATFSTNFEKSTNLVTRVTKFPDTQGINIFTKNLVHSRYISPDQSSFVLIDVTVFLLPSNGSTYFEKKTFLYLHFAPKY